MQAVLQRWWVNALIKRKATHKLARQDKEVFALFSVIQAIGVFPRNGIDGVICGNKQDTFRLSIELTPGCCLWWEQSLIHTFAISNRVIDWLRWPLLTRGECK